MDTMRTTFTGESDESRVVLVVYYNSDTRNSYCASGFGLQGLINIFAFTSSSGWYANQQLSVFCRSDQTSHKGMFRAGSRQKKWQCLLVKNFNIISNHFHECMASPG